MVTCLWVGSKTCGDLKTGEITKVVRSGSRPKVRVNRQGAWRRGYLKGNKKHPLATMSEIRGDPENMRRWNNVGLMLSHRPQRFPNIKSTFVQRLSFAGKNPLAIISDIKGRVTDGWHFTSGILSNNMMWCWSQSSTIDQREHFTFKGMFGGDSHQQSGPMSYHQNNELMAVDWQLSMVFSTIIN